MKFNSKLTHNELFELLEELHDKYNRQSFISDDPISVPHSFSAKEDIEIAGFFSATIAWGQRPQIVKNARWLMALMDNAPYDFIVNHSQSDFEQVKKFYYRTFQFVDLEFFIRVLRDIYINKGGLENLLTEAWLESRKMEQVLITLFDTFVKINHLPRSMKHVANISMGSSAKRLNMFLRWMVRSDKRGVDFGIWKNFPTSALFIPLDVHSGRVARELGILKRKQNDWNAVVELTSALRTFDPLDPVKYDFALFGAGVDKNIDWNI